MPYQFLSRLSALCILSVTLAFIGGHQAVAKGSHTSLTQPTAKRQNHTDQSKNTCRLLFEDGWLENSDEQRLPSDNTLYEIFSFQGHANQVVKMSGISLYIDTGLFLLSQEGEVLISNNDTVTRNSLIEDYVLPYTGEYFLVINALTATDISDDSGIFRVYVSSQECE